jgi:cytochrome b subunit of formate dehydrogenase
MQQAEMVHSIVAMLFIAVMLAHIYIGTIGMEGRVRARGVGQRPKLCRSKLRLGTIIISARSYR